jgi:threonine dehydratase
MSPYKCKRIEEFGAIVRTIGETQDDAQAEVDQIVANGLMVEIAPFDDKAIVCGQGTVGLEILDERPDIRTIIAPLSGGGLIGGTGIVAKAFDTSIFVVGATLEHGAAMAESIRSGRPARVQEQPTIADALSGGIGENNKWTLKLCKELVDEIIQVPDAAIPEAMRRLFDEHRLVTEGAGAIAVAALDAMQQKDGDVAVILSGNNIDSDEFFSFVRHL